MAKVQHDGRQRNRPLSVTLISWGVFLVGLANVWRAAGLYRQRELLLALGAKPDPWLRSLLAFFWALVFVVMAVAVWLKRPVARVGIPVLLFVHGLFQLALPLLFTAPAESGRGWPAAAILYAGAVLYTTWALNRSAISYYFEIRD